MSKGWKTVCLEKLVDVINGFAFSSERFTEEQGLPLVRIRDLENQITKINYDGDYDEKYLIDRGDLLIGMDGDFLTVKWKGGKALLNQRVCKLLSKDKHELNQEFLFYRILEEIDLIHRVTAGTTVKHLSSSDILSIQIELSKIEEQEQIATVLSTIDRAIEQIEAIIAKQQRIKTGMMYDLLTKGIDEDGNIRSEETHEFKNSAIGRIPVEWEVKDLREVSLIVDPNPSHRYPPPSDIGIPIASTENFVGANEFDLSFAEKVPFSVFEQQNERCSFSKTDVVFARKGRLGFARPYGESKKVFSHTVVIFKPRNSEQIDPCYLLWIVRFYDFFKQIEKRMNSNSGVPTLGVEFLGSVPMRVPKLDEQIKICSVLNYIEMRVEDSQRNLSKQKLQKAGLMQDLLTGKVRVTPLLDRPST